MGHALLLLLLLLLSNLAVVDLNRLGTRIVLCDPELFQCDYINIPTTVFTPIEYGAIGLAEEDAIAKYGDDDIDVSHTFQSTHNRQSKQYQRRDSDYYSFSSKACKSVLLHRRGAMLIMI